MRITRTANHPQGFRIIRTVEGQSGDRGIPSRDEAASMVAEYLGAGESSKDKTVIANVFYVRALYELFYQAEIDSVDTSTANVAKSFGDRWGQRMFSSASTAAAKIGTDEGDAAKDHIKAEGVKIMLAVRVRNNPEVSLFAGPGGYVADRLDKIAQVFQASESFRSYFESIVEGGERGGELVNRQSVVKEVGKIQKGILSQYARSPAQIRRHMSAGIMTASVAVPQRLGGLPAGTRLQVDPDILARSLVSSVPSGYAKFMRDRPNAVLPDSTTLRAFGEMIFAVAFIAMNQEVYGKNATALQMVNDGRQSLNDLSPTHSNWVNFLDQKQRQAVAKFSTTPSQATADEDHGPTKQAKKNSISAIFLEAEQRISKDGVSGYKASALSADITAVASSYANYVVGQNQKKWPADDKVRVVAAVVCEILALAAGDVDKDIDLRRKLSDAVRQGIGGKPGLDHLWPDWRRVLPRARHSNEGPLQTLIELEHVGGRGGIYTAQYERMFLVMSSSLEGLIMDAVNRARVSVCQSVGQDDKLAEMCQGYARLENAINGDSTTLAKPMTVSGCFSPDNKPIHTPGYFMAAEHILESIISLYEDETLDDVSIKEICNKILMQVHQWGKSAANDFNEFTWAANPMGDDKTTGGGTSVEERFQQQFVASDTWAFPTTIVMGSVMLWVIYGKARGLRR